jgi:hypothetical protein
MLLLIAGSRIDRSIDSPLSHLPGMKAHLMAPHTRVPPGSGSAASTTPRRSCSAQGLGFPPATGDHIPNAPVFISAHQTRPACLPSANLAVPFVKAQPRCASNPQLLQQSWRCARCTVDSGFLWMPCQFSASAARRFICHANRLMTWQVSLPNTSTVTSVNLMCPKSVARAML